MITLEEKENILNDLKTSKNPLFFYDDDPDGLCSFLLIYKIYSKGFGFIIKSTPKIDSKFLRKVEEKNPDTIFILDIPIVETEFIVQAGKKIVWIDHHKPQNIFTDTNNNNNKSIDLNKIRYYNPRIKNIEAYIPTTRIAYQLNKNSENLWIAMIGCLGDWYLPDFTDEFIQKYPRLLPVKKDLNDAVYHQPIGKLVQIFSFLLKGQTSEISKCIKILTRINDPFEILEQTTPRGKYLYQRYELIKKEYVNLLNRAKKSATRNNLMIFIYETDNNSFTSELSNELTNLYPKKTVIICRKKSGEMKCSLRSKSNISKPLEKALIGINGYGGGHEQACGAVIKEENWKMFLDNLKKEIKKQK